MQPTDPDRRRAATLPDVRRRGGPPVRPMPATAGRFRNCRDSSSVPADGPLPEFYEPVESPTTNILHPEVQYNPCLKYPRLKAHQPIGTVDEYPYVLCTSSLTEHWCAGSVTRNIPWLNEMYPETIIEMPKKLAEEHGIASGDWVRVWSARGEVEVKALVTDRMQTLNVNGKEVTIVWMPYNWGFKGLSTAASTNLLTIDAGDPNTWIQETKACLINLIRPSPPVSGSCGESGYARRYLRADNPVRP